MSTKGHQMSEINLNKRYDYPQSSHNPYEDEQEIAQQKRRKERLKRKKQKRRERPEFEDGDLDTLLESQTKKSKRRKSKNGRSNLWYDERYDEETTELWQDDYEYDEYDDYDE